ncbi:hypothetical protein J6590_008297 [Homalodisca vitripennis]|nr:hypothetical protein J6590_008297 [Homalodisca vitripennis]
MISRSRKPPAEFPGLFQKSQICAWKHCPLPAALGAPQKLLPFSLRVILLLTKHSQLRGWAQWAFSRWNAKKDPRDYKYRKLGSDLVLISLVHGI